MYGYFREIIFALSIRYLEQSGARTYQYVVMVYSDTVLHAIVTRDLMSCSVSFKTEDPYRHPAANDPKYCGECLKRCWCPIELPTPVVGHDDAVDADGHCDLCVPRRQESLDDDGERRDGPEPGDDLPGQAAVNLQPVKRSGYICLAHNSWDKLRISKLSACVVLMHMLFVCTQ